jgi:hypothetical protein
MQRPRAQYSTADEWPAGRIYSNAAGVAAWRVWRVACGVCGVWRVWHVACGVSCLLTRHQRLILALGGRGLQSPRTGTSMSSAAAETGVRCSTNSGYSTPVRAQPQSPPSPPRIGCACILTVVRAVTHRWKEVEATGDPPQARSVALQLSFRTTRYGKHLLALRPERLPKGWPFSLRVRVSRWTQSVTAVGKRLFVFGGWTHDANFNDLHIFDTGASRFSHACGVCVRCVVCAVCAVCVIILCLTHTQKPSSGALER